MDRPYPAHWEADVVLRDGGTAHLRPITPGDADRLRTFHRGQSAESIYFRFFAPYPELSDRDVHRFTVVDHVDRVAIVATIGEAIIGVVRWDRVDETSADVAFNIADAHQGRGLGSVLLEHAAAAARERRVERFIAAVLPSNRRMLAVFTDAGYAMHTEVDDGIVYLSLDLEPTETSRAVVAAREQRAEARSIQRLLKPSSIAVIGASRTYDSIGQTLLRNLLAAGFTGPVHAVNPGCTEVAGQRAYPSVVDVPGSVDLAIVAVPVDAVPQVVLDCARKGVRGLLVVTAGYAEAGRRGSELRVELAVAAHAHGMRVVGPNSFGIIDTDPSVQLNASLAVALPGPGRLGFFSQSGGLSLTLLDTAVQRGLGISSFVSAGDRADVSGNDLLQYWEEDPATEVVLLYLESLGNPRKFSRLARRLGRRKPVVAVKSGRTTQGAPLGERRASRAPAAAVDAIFAQAGVIRVETPAQLFDVGQLLATQPLPGGERVAVVGNSRALELLVADGCAERGLRVTGEPVSLRPDASGEDYRAALAGVFADPDVDSVVAVFSPPLLTLDEDVARVLAGAAAGTDKTVVSTFLGLRGVPPQLRRESTAEGAPRGATDPAPRGSVPSYATPEEAVNALAAVTRYALWRQRPHGSLPDFDDIDAVRGHAVVERVLRAAPEGVDLGAADLAELLAAYGVSLWPWRAAPTPEAAVEAAEALGFPVVVKAIAPHLRYRPDRPDVRLGLADAAAVRAAAQDIIERLPRTPDPQLIVQSMAPMGVACVIDSVEDPLFGPIISFGLAGVATELLEDRCYRIPPLTDADAAEMVRSVKASPLLFGYRGAPQVDAYALEDLLLRISCLADDLPEVARLILDPVLVAPGGLQVLRARGRVEPAMARTDSGPRRMVG